MRLITPASPMLGHWRRGLATSISYDVLKNKKIKIGDRN